MVVELCDVIDLLEMFLLDRISNGPLYWFCGRDEMLLLERSLVMQRRKQQRQSSQQEPEKQEAAGIMTL